MLVRCLYMIYTICLIRIGELNIYESFKIISFKIRHHHYFPGKQVKSYILIRVRISFPNSVICAGFVILQLLRPGQYFFVPATPENERASRLLHL